MHQWTISYSKWGKVLAGNPTEGEGSVQLTSLTNKMTDHLAMHQCPVSYSKWGKVPAGNPHWRQSIWQYTNVPYLTQSGEGTCRQPLLKAEAQYSWPPCTNEKREHLAIHQWPISYSKWGKVPARNSCWRGRLSTVNLRVLTSLDQLLLILQTLFTFLQNKLPYWGGQQSYWAWYLHSLKTITFNCQ
jgi:hypothetical protein